MRSASLLLAILVVSTTGACGDDGPPSAQECLERVATYLDDLGADNPPESEAEVVDAVGVECSDPSILRDLSDAEVDEALSGIDPEVAEQLRSRIQRLQARDDG